MLHDAPHGGPENEIRLARKFWRLVNVEQEQMASYREIQATVHQDNGFVPQTCWIAHVLADQGKPMRIAANRIDPAVRQKPCPPTKRPAIESALRKLGMIS